MDGGKGHVSTALEVIDATGFDIPVALWRSRHVRLFELKVVFIGPKSNLLFFLSSFVEI